MRGATRCLLVVLLGAGCQTTGDVLQVIGDGGGSGGGSDPGSGSGVSGSSGGGDGSSGATAAPTGCSAGDPGLWCPAPGLTWQKQLTGTADFALDVNVNDADIKLLDASTVASLHALSRRVICYFSAGASWPNDADAAALGPFEGELVRVGFQQRWLDVRAQGVREVMAARMDLTVQYGCDAIEPADLHGYASNSGFALTQADAESYMLWLAEQAHARGLAVGLQDNQPLIATMADQFDFAVNRGCMVDDSCDALAEFVDRNKSVFHLEYVLDPVQPDAQVAEVCPQAAALSFSTILKKDDLNAYVVPCE